MSLITDRTEADALLKTAKGTYGYTDLNRVEKAVADVAAFFPALGFDTLHLETKTDWGSPQEFSTEAWPVKTQMNRYIKNVIAVRDAFDMAVYLPSRMDRLTWKYANNIEKVLEQAHLYAINATEAFRYSGEIYSGEG